jgi:acylpyruvate hydrolase
VRFVTFVRDGVEGIAIANSPGTLRGYLRTHAAYPGSLLDLLRRGSDALAAAGRRLQQADELDDTSLAIAPPLSNPPKIICIGLNYIDHATESGLELPRHPTVFGRFASSLIGHKAALIRPRVSVEFDYEGELVAVIGKPGRHIAKVHALAHISGYSIFNDASVRDYQRKSPQWTMGKNFDGSGAFGPEFVTADELPTGARGLHLETRLSGSVVQSANTSDMIFDVATLVATLSEAMTLECGDVIVTGTPAGVGAARTPPLFMKAGDVCEVQIEGLGVLRNSVADETQSHTLLAAATPNHHVIRGQSNEQ